MADKSVIILENHYDGKDTILARIQGNVYMSNGCQTFHESELDAMCLEYVVSEQQKELVLNSIKQLTVDVIDFNNELTSHWQFIQYFYPILLPN